MCSDLTAGFSVERVTHPLPNLNVLSRALCGWLENPGSAVLARLSGGHAIGSNKTNHTIRIAVPLIAHQRQGPDRHTQLSHHPSTFKGLLLPPTCPSPTRRSSDLPSLFFHLFKSDSTPPTTANLLRFSRTHNAEQHKKKERRRRTARGLFTFSHLAPSPHNTPSATYSHTHTHIRGASENLN